MVRELISLLGGLLAAGPAIAQLRPDGAATVGMSQSRLEGAARLVDSEVASGRMCAAAILVARHGRIVLHRGFGRLSSAPGAAPVQPDSVFLIASITKPVTACALMMLVERGQVLLNDPVSQYLSGFQGPDREKVRVRDLLSHTSGLPDMLPENIALRRAHAPLAEFVRHSMTTPLLFPPGTQCRYQSMGILLAAEIVERTVGMPLREFEKKEIFGPLGMKDSSLGLGGRRIADLVSCEALPGADPADEERFGANSPYWRDMGHPWGGMHSTTSDLAAFLQTFLNGGAYGPGRVLSPVTSRAMISDQNTGLSSPWGLGWALGRSRSWNVFGDLASPSLFGHAGSTGTVAWADPEKDLLCVLLTSRPFAADGGRFLARVSNTVAASVVK